MRISPDSVIVGEIFGLEVPMTIAGSWAVIAPLAAASFLITRRFSPDFKMSRVQNATESAVIFLRNQIEETLERPADKYIPFVGSMFIFILASNWSAILPVPFKTDEGWEMMAPATASLSTTAALAIMVMLSTIWFGIRARGWRGYFAKFFKPVFAMLPLNLMIEISGGLALAVRLYGNIMSGAVLGAIVFMLAPLIFPAVLSIYGLLAGTIQPYIFLVLSLVYIGSAMGAPTKAERESLEQLKERRT